MNHRILFFLSVMIIAVGITGIVMQKKQTSDEGNAPSARQGGKTKVIAIAETLKDLQPHHILSDADYQIRVIEVDEETQDIRNISSLGNHNLNGYLIRTSLPKNSAILPEMVEAPTSETFVLHSLKPDEQPYSYQVKPQDSYLLTSLSVGDNVSLYIRLVEHEKGRTNNVGLESESGSSRNQPNPKYTLSRISGPLSVIEIGKDKNQIERGGYAHDEPVGSIVLRVSRKQLADLRVVEKAGEILLFPAGSDGNSDKKLRMDEVLTQFRAVKELRGGK